MEPNLTHSIKEINNATFFALLEKELADRKSVRFRVKGISMQPLLRNNRDEVQLVQCGKEPLHPGDICLFKYQGRHILHRYVKNERGMLYFQGDNVLNRYECCRQEDVVGVVQKVYRDGQSLPPLTKAWKIRIAMHRCKQRIRFAITSHIPDAVRQKLKKLLRMN